MDNTPGAKHARRRWHPSDDAFLAARTEEQLVAAAEQVESKRCSGCKKTKTREEFSRNASREDALQTTCKSCDRDRGLEYTKDARRWLAELRAQRPYCELSDVAALECHGHIEFDHVEPKTKVRAITDVGFWQKKGKVAFDEEAAKVRAVCALHHYQITRQQEHQRHLDALPNMSRDTIRRYERRQLRHAYVNVIKRDCRVHCNDCGFVVWEGIEGHFEFDNEDGSSTTHVGVSWLCSHYKAFTRIAKEMQRCVLRCKSCHHKVTREREEEDPKFKRATRVGVKREARDEGILPPAPKRRRPAHGDKPIHVV